MALQQGVRTKTPIKEHEMDVLQLEIEIAQDDLTRVAIYWDGEQLEIGDIVLTGEEVNEVLLTVRRLKEKKLAALRSLQAQGATA